MTQIKKNIKLLIIIAAVSFVISYFISINIEQGFITLNSKWASNEFALACFCSVFASTIILMATEIQKYYNEKQTVEHFTFNQMVSVYGELRWLRKYIFDVLQTKCYDDIQFNLFTHTTYILAQNKEFFRLTDYNTILKRKNNRRIEIISKISTKLVNKFQETISVINFLHQAILTDKINYNEKILKSGKGDDDRLNTIKTLRIILNVTDSVVNELYNYIVNLDSACNCRFRWMEIESKISNPPDFSSSLESFYNQYASHNIKY